MLLFIHSFLTTSIYSTITELSIGVISKTPNLGEVVNDARMTNTQTHLHHIAIIENDPGWCGFVGCMSKAKLAEIVQSPAVKL